MTSRLCDFKKSLRQDLTAYVRSVVPPTHVCIKCGRVANRKKLLCDPVKLPKLKR